MFRPSQIVFDAAEVEKTHLSPYVTVSAAAEASVRVRRQGEDRSVVIEGRDRAAAMELLRLMAAGGTERQLEVELRRRGAVSPTEWLNACRLARILE